LHKIFAQQTIVVETVPARTLLTSASAAGPKCKWKALHFDCEVAARHRTHDIVGSDHDDCDDGGDVEGANAILRPMRRGTPWHRSLPTNNGQSERHIQWRESMQVLDDQPDVTEFQVLRQPKRKCTPYRACIQESVEDDSESDASIPYCAEPICRVVDAQMQSPAYLECRSELWGGRIGASEADTMTSGKLGTENVAVGMEVRSEAVDEEAGTGCKALEVAAEAFKKNLEAELEPDQAEFMLHLSQFDALSPPGLEEVDIDRGISYYYSTNTFDKDLPVMQCNKIGVWHLLCDSGCAAPSEAASMTKTRSVFLM